VAVRTTNMEVGVELPVAEAVAAVAVA
jgi:hypothetical protein